MAIQNETKTASEMQQISGWIERRDENGEVIFIKPMIFNPEVHTVESGHVLPQLEKEQRFGTRRPMRQRVSL